MDARLLLEEAAIAAEEAGDLSTALERWGEAVASYPRAPAFRLRRAFALHEFGLPRLALGYLRKALSLGPDEPGAHYLLGRHWLRRNRRARAREAFEQALRLGDERAKGALAELARRLSPRIPARLRREEQG